MNGIYKKLASQVFIYGLANIFPRLITYIFALVLTYIFKNPQTLSVNTEFYSYISFLNIMFLYGMETAFLNFANQHADNKKVYTTAFVSIVITTIIFTTLLIFYAQNLSSLTNYNLNTQFIIWSALIIATDALLALPLMRLRFENKASLFALNKCINVLVFISVNVFFLVICKQQHDLHTNAFLASCYNPNIGVGYTFIAGVAANVLSLIMILPSIFKIPFAFDFTLYKKMLRYALPILILGLAGMTNETFDRIILKYLLPIDEGTYQLGVYGACYKLSMLITIFTTAFKLAIEPFIFKTSKQFNSQHHQNNLTHYYIIFCLILFLFLTLNISWIKNVISFNYQVGIGVVPILLIANICLGIFWNISIWFKTSNNALYGTFITIVGSVVTVGLNFYYIPQYGYVACAWATLISYLTMMLLTFFVLKYKFQITFKLNRTLWFTVLSFAIFYVTKYINYNSEIFKLIINNLLFFGFVLTIFFIEKKHIKSKLNF